MYKCTTTKPMHDICAHSSLPTSAINALCLLKKKKDGKMNNFAWAVVSSEMSFWISGTSQAYFGSLKVCINTDTTVENAYTVKSA